jgi:vacuolar-type H+-ATPase subunit I/STV1
MRLPTCTLLICALLLGCSPTAEPPPAPSSKPAQPQPATTSQAQPLPAGPSKSSETDFVAQIRELNRVVKGLEAEYQEELRLLKELDAKLEAQKKENADPGKTSKQIEEDYRRHVERYRRLSRELKASNERLKKLIDAYEKKRKQ